MDGLIVVRIAVEQQFTGMQSADGLEGKMRHNLDRTQVGTLRVATMRIVAPSYPGVNLFLEMFALIKTRPNLSGPP